MKTSKYNFLKDCYSAVITDVCDEHSIKFNILHNLTSNNAKNSFYGTTNNIELECGDFRDANLDQGVEVLENLGSDNVLFVRGSDKFAYFGELMGLHCDRKNISGVIIDGKTRDSHSFKNYKFPIYSDGYTPLDIRGRGRIKSVNCDIVTDKYTVKNNSFILCDSDACVVLDIEDFNKISNLIKEEMEKEKTAKHFLSIGKSIRQVEEEVKRV